MNFHIDIFFANFAFFFFHSSRELFFDLLRRLAYKYILLSSKSRWGNFFNTNDQKMISTRLKRLYIPFDTFFLMISLLYVKPNVYKQNHMLKSSPKPKSNDKNMTLILLDRLNEVYQMLSCRRSWCRNVPLLYPYNNYLYFYGVSQSKRVGRVVM